MVRVRRLQVEPIVCLICAVVIPGIVWISIKQTHDARNKRTHSLHSIAGELNDARVSPPSFTTEPSLQYRFLDDLASFTFKTSGGKNPVRWNHFNVRHQRSVPKIHLTKQGNLMSEVATALGMQDILIGSTAFDQDFRIRGGPESKVRQVLTKDVQAQVNALGPRFIEVYLSTAEFTVKVRDWFESGDQVSDYIQSCQRLYLTLMDNNISPLSKVAEDRGLELQPIHDPVAHRFSGTLRGVQITAQLDSDETLNVRARWQGPARQGQSRLSGLQIIHRDSASHAQKEQGIDLNNPVLDHMVCVLCDDPRAARDALNQPGLADVVLPVVHGHPGSVIDATHVHLLGTRISGEQVGEAIDLVVAAVSGLSNPA